MDDDSFLDIDEIVCTFYNSTIEDEHDLQVCQDCDFLVDYKWRMNM